MESRTRTRASIGATLVVTMLAAAIMLLNPAPASAQGLTVSDGLITIGPISVEQTDPCDMNVSETHWQCDDFIVSGGDPDVPNVSILAHVDLFEHGEHWQILLVAVTLPDGCTISMHGPYLIDHITGTEYHSEEEVGAYLLSSCDSGITFLIVAVLGFSPSTTDVLVGFNI